LGDQPSPAAAPKNRFPEDEETPGLAVYRRILSGITLVLLTPELAWKTGRINVRGERHHGVLCAREFLEQRKFENSVDEIRKVNQIDKFRNGTKT
jgi:hypothetical protein